LGILFTENGDRDMTRAASLFAMAAKQEDADAQYYLGLCYEQGLGVPSNPCKAADLYRQSAGAGHARAYHSLALLFETGAAGKNFVLPMYLNFTHFLFLRFAGR
jgi:TPR repeat protein